MPPVTVKTPPTAQPATLEELRDHLRIDGDDGALNGNLTRSLASATAMIERDAGIAIVERTLVLHLTGFPAGACDIDVPTPPLRSVVSVKYLDTDGAQQTLDPAAYAVDNARQPGRVVLQPGQSWPATKSIVGAVTVEYTAGSATVANDEATGHPDDLKAAVLMLAGHLFENPEAATTVKLEAVPLALDRILDMYRMPRI